MKLKLFSILTVLLFVVVTQFTFSQELDEIVEELKEPLELTDEQEEKFAKLLGWYGVQLNEAMDKNEEADEKADPKEMIGQFKTVRDAYREDLQKILSEEQYVKYQEIISNVLFEMFTDIAEIKIMDLKKPLELTDKQAEQLAPVMGKSLMEMMKVVVEYGDKRMSMPRKVKVGKKMKAIQAEGRSGAEMILTGEQMATWDKMKEENKAKSEG
jgi:hypothetical protein